MAGYVALRDCLRDRIGSAALPLSIVGLNFLTAFFGVMAIAYPKLAGAYLQGDSGAVQIAAQAVGSPTTLAVMGLTGINVIGLVLFAIAMWRTGWMPKGASLFFVVGPLMQLVPWVYPVEILGCVLVLVSGLWIATTVTNHERVAT